MREKCGWWAKKRSKEMLLKSYDYNLKHSVGYLSVLIAKEDSLLQKISPTLSENLPGSKERPQRRQRKHRLCHTFQIPIKNGVMGERTAEGRPAAVGTWTLTDYTAAGSGRRPRLLDTDCWR
uniref:Uncharacterized protein n=1 Tax=Globodera rostochiensis TaxID=31243 RepID=A0A914GUF9_GLORO